jgi:hypothetical protein
VEVEVIQHQAVRALFDRYEPDSPTVNADVPRTRGLEARAKPFSRTLGVEPPQPFQAFTHRRNAQRQQLLEIPLAGFFEVNRHANAH